MEYCPHVKNDEIMPFTATWLDLEMIILILSEVSQRKTNMIWCCLYVESKKKKKDRRELIYKTEIDSHRKQTCGYQNGKGSKDKLRI